MVRHHCTLEPPLSTSMWQAATGLALCRNHPVGNLITTPEEAADAVTLAHNLGFPGIKIGIHDGSMEQTPHLTPEMAKSICDRAHALHMWVAAHIGNCKGARFMLDAGVDELAHTPSDPMPEDMIREMAEKGIVMDTTVGDPDKEMAPPPMMDLPDGMKPPEGMGPPPGPMMPMDPAEMKRQQTEKMKIMEENLGRFYRAGSKIVVGTDLIHNNTPKPDSAQEPSFVFWGLALSETTPFCILFIILLILLLQPKKEEFSNEL